MLVVWMTGTQPDARATHKLIHRQSGERMLEEEGLGERAFMLSQAYAGTVRPCPSAGWHARMGWICRRGSAALSVLSPPSPAIHRVGRPGSLR